MRDIFVTLIVFGTLPFIFKRPYIGILLWGWLAYMNPHKLSWGFAHEFPFSKIVALVILVALLFGSLVLIGKVGFIFMPGGGEETMIIEVKLPQGKNLQATLKQVKEVEKPPVKADPRDKLLKIVYDFRYQANSRIQTKPNANQYTPN